MLWLSKEGRLLYRQLYLPSKHSNVEYVSSPFVHMLDTVNKQSDKVQLFCA